MKKNMLLILLAIYLSSCSTKTERLTLLSNKPINKTNFSINTKNNKTQKVYEGSSLTHDQIYLLETTLGGRTLVNVEHQANYGSVFNKKCTIKGYDVTM